MSIGWFFHNSSINSSLRTQAQYPIHTTFRLFVQEANTTCAKLRFKWVLVQFLSSSSQRVCLAMNYQEQPLQDFVIKEHGLSHKGYKTECLVLKTEYKPHVYKQKLLNQHMNEDQNVNKKNSPLIVTMPYNYLPHFCHVRKRVLIISTCKGIRIQINSKDRTLSTIQRMINLFFSHRRQTLSSSILPQN